MTWGMVGAAAITVVGGYMANKSANKGASKGANAQIAYQQQADAQRRADMMPFMQAGYDALGKQTAFLNGDTSGFENSPDYKFRMEQGIKANDRSAAAGGGLFSGGHYADLTRFAQGTAAQGANDYWAKLAGQAGQSFNASTNMANLGQQSAQYMGNARQSAYQQQGENNAGFYGGTANTLASLYGNYMGRRNG